MLSIAIWRPPFGQGLPVPPQALTLPTDSPALEWQGNSPRASPLFELFQLLQLLRVALACRALVAAVGVAPGWAPVPTLQQAAEALPGGVMPDEFTVAAKARSRSRPPRQRPPKPASSRPASASGTSGRSVSSGR